MRAICIIPARGGSKRIPRKNIRTFLGKPIISYSIENAHESGVFDRIIVSTDSFEIAQTAKDFGAEIPFMRPPDLSDDFSTTDEVIRHALEWVVKNGLNLDYLCCLYPTAPFASPTLIKKGLERMKKTKAPSAFSVTTFPYPIFRALRKNKHDRMQMIWPEYLKTRSQDLETAYHDAGQFYWADVNQINEGPLFLRNGAVGVEIPATLVQDIDTEDDWALAEMKYRIAIERGYFS
jgi:N-acylneuraminate cytidylyltransferase